MILLTITQLNDILSFFQNMIYLSTSHLLIRNKVIRKGAYHIFIKHLIEIQYPNWANKVHNTMILVKIM